MKVRWSRHAALDLVAVEEFVALDSPAAGAALVERLVSRSEGLAEHPGSGRVVPEFGNDRIRELVIDAYRLVYRLEGNCVEVLTVFEGHRQMPIELVDE